MIGFLWFYIEHWPHTLVALAVGAVLHVPLRALWLGYTARAKQAITSIVPKV
jgi:hypothetical protein